VKNKFVWAIVLAVLVVAGDLYTKHLITSTMQYGDYFEVSSFFNIAHVRNTGAAFGLLSDANESIRVPFFIAISVLAFTVINFLVYKASDDRKVYITGLGLILGGAMGNFVDRIRYGFVIDFLDFHWGPSHWPAFNVADMGISIGVGLLLLDMLLDERRQRMMEAEKA
jgi:signal peptidase II